MELTRWLPTWQMRLVRRCVSTIPGPWPTLWTMGFST
jgi:hypothetical protein